MDLAQHCLNNLERDLRIGERYSKTKAYKNKYDKLIRDLSYFLNASKVPYVALSWGKQSIVIAHAIYDLKPDIPMVFLRSWESYLLHDYENVISSFEHSINYIEHYKDNVSWNDWDWKKTRDYGQKDIQQMADECIPNWDGVCMGLSKDESVARRITCSLSKEDNNTIFKYTDGKVRSTPIQHWSNTDLAAYISTHDIRLLSTYSNTGLKGRTTARITRNNAEMNGMKELKKTNMSNYNKIVNRFPELSVY